MHYQSLEFLSEQELIVLCEIFMQPGFHTLEVANVSVGRSLILTLLTSLNYYKRPGVITPADPSPMGNVVSLLPLLEHDEDFIAQEQCDFIWIEAGKDLMDSARLAPVVALLRARHTDVYNPIIQISCQARA